MGCIQCEPFSACSFNSESFNIGLNNCGGCCGWVLWLALVPITGLCLYYMSQKKILTPTIAVIIYFMSLLTISSFFCITSSAYILLYNYFFRQPTFGQQVLIVFVPFLISLLIVLNYKKYNLNYKLLLLVLLILSLTVSLVNDSIHNFYGLQTKTFNLSDGFHSLLLNCKDDEHLDFVIVEGNLSCTIPINQTKGYAVKQIKVWLNRNESDSYLAQINQEIISLQLPIKNTTNINVNITATPLINESQEEVWELSKSNDFGLYSFFTKKEYDERLNNRLIFVAGFFGVVITVLYYLKDYLLPNLKKEKPLILIRCINCKHENRKNAKYCDKCGRRLQ